MNPYQVLEVHKNASSEVVKDAYRKKAQKWHPDRNRRPEAKERFQEIQRAYELLSDPERRAFYDEHGEDKPKVTNLDVVAKETICVIFLKIIDEGHNLSTLDVIEAVKTKVNIGIRNHSNLILTQTSKIERLQRAVSRVTKTATGDNMFESLANHQIREAKFQIEKEQEWINLGHRMLEILNDYQYRVDPSKGPAYITVVLGS